MARINGSVYRVDIIESERGWGSRLDEVLYFDNEQEAREYCLKYNTNNTAPIFPVPDWYMIAQYRGKV